MALAVSVNPYMWNSDTSLLNDDTCDPSLYNSGKNACNTNPGTESCIKYRMCINRDQSKILDATKKTAAEAETRYADMSRQYWALLWVCLNLSIGIAVFLFIAWYYR